MAPDDLQTHGLCHSEKSGRGGTARAIARLPKNQRQKGRTHAFARTEMPVPSRGGCGWQVLLLAPPKRPDRPSTSTRLRGKAGGKSVPPICGRCRHGAQQAAARFRRSPRRLVGFSEPRAAEVWLLRRQCMPKGLASLAAAAQAIPARRYPSPRASAVRRLGDGGRVWLGESPSPCRPFSRSLAGAGIIRGLFL